MAHGILILLLAFVAHAEEDYNQGDPNLAQKYDGAYFETNDKTLPATDVDTTHGALVKPRGEIKMPLLKKGKKKPPR